MAERNASANSRILLIGDGATPTEEFNPMACLTENSLNGTTNVTTTETKCGTITEPGTQNATVQFAGTILLDPANDKQSAGAMFTLWKNKTWFNFKYGPANPVTGDLVKIGRGFISTYEESDGVNTIPTFSGTITLDAAGLSQTVVA